VDAQLYHCASSPSSDAERDAERENLINKPTGMVFIKKTVVSDTRVPLARTKQATSESSAAIEIGGLGKANTVGVQPLQSFEAQLARSVGYWYSGMPHTVVC